MQECRIGRPDNVGRGENTDMESLSGAGSSLQGAALEALAAQIGVGLVLLDAGGRAEFCNRRALELLDLADAADLTRNWPRMQATLGVEAAPAHASAQRSFRVELALAQASRSLRVEILPLAAAGGGTAV